MQGSKRIRGQPLLVLIVLLGGWLGLRVMLWQSPFPQLSSRQRTARIQGQSGKGESTLLHAGPELAGRLPLPTAEHQAEPAPGSTGYGGPLALERTVALASRQQSAPPAKAEEPVAARTAVGEQMLLAAGISQMELPSAIAALLAASKRINRSSATLATSLPESRPTPRLTGASRWSADGWLLLRRDSAGLLAAVQPSYGRSQAGAVLRYRLAPSNGHRPVAFARATGSLAGPSEKELAVGLAARPFAGVPVSLAGEVRLYETAGRREVRPAAFAATELPPAILPFGVRGEAYLQAGYVGGRFATGFVDGQARIDAALGRVAGTAELRLGGGLWGGAQKHTARLDVGPSATMSFRLGQAQSRLALDYRWRVAGNAMPESGPALTISAGF